MRRLLLHGEWRFALLRAVVAPSFTLWYASLPRRALATTYLHTTRFTHTHTRTQTPSTLAKNLHPIYPLDDVFT